MVVVDSSVWIDLFRGMGSPAERRLRALTLEEDILVGDLVTCEVLMGARDDAEAQRIETYLRQFPQAVLSSHAIAVQAAANYRRLRGLGLTVRRMADLLIGTFCITHGHTLLHRDRDFDAMARHLGLRAIAV